MTQRRRASDGAIYDDGAKGERNRAIYREYKNSFETEPNRMRRFVTFKALAVKYGVTVERVRQIYYKEGRRLDARRRHDEIDIRDALAQELRGLGRELRNNYMRHTTKVTVTW